MHLDLNQAVALAFFASAALHVETKAAGRIAADARGGQLRKQIADVIKHAGVSRWVASRGAADGCLIDDDDFVDQILALDGAMLAWRLFRAVHVAEKRALKNIHHERALAAAAHARNARQCAQRKARIDVLQIILMRPQDLDPAALLARRYTLLRHSDAQLTAKIFCGQGSGRLQ